MSRRSRQQILNQLHATQVTHVQGPPMMGEASLGGYIRTDTDLGQKYIGAGLHGLAASLYALSTSSADELLCQHGYELYRKMALDSEIEANLRTIIQAATSEPINVISPYRPSDPRYDRSSRYAEWMNKAFLRFDINMWRRQSMRYCLTYGNTVSEKAYVEDGGRIYYEDLRLLEPEIFDFIVDRWNIVHGIVPRGIAQVGTIPVGNMIPLSSTGLATLIPQLIPRYKITHWCWEKRGTDPRGTSHLRAAHIPFWAKQRTMEEWSCFLGRYAQPSLVGTTSPDATLTKDPKTGQMLEPTQALLNALQNYRNASVIALPHGSEVKLLDTSAGADVFLKSLAAWNVEISRALTGQHLASNEGQNQSRAAAEVHALILRQMIAYAREFIGRQINIDVIKPLMEMNFGRVYEFMPVMSNGDSDGYPPTITDTMVGYQAGYFTEDQMPKLDRMYGYPVRETNIPTGPQVIANATRPDIAPPERESRRR